MARTPLARRIEQGVAAAAGEHLTRRGLLKRGVRSGGSRRRGKRLGARRSRDGQYTKFAGAEREQSGACHFAGEHTSIDLQGYLNGAVESGERAAGEVLSDLKR